MGSNFVQRELVFRVAAVEADVDDVADAAFDFSASIQAASILIEREAVSIPANGKTGEPDEEAGLKRRRLQIDWSSNPLSATSLATVLRTAQDTDDAEVFFMYRLSDAAVGATNPWHKGVIRVTGEIPQGGKVGEWRSVSSTFPIASGTYETLAADPA